MLSLAGASLIHVALVFVLVGSLDMGWKGICIASATQFVARFIIA